jgi:hypothetical protein
MTGIEPAARTSRSLSSTRRNFLRTVAVGAGACRSVFAASGAAEIFSGNRVPRSFSSLNPTEAASDSDESTRPFQINFPDAAIHWPPPEDRGNKVA